MLVKKLFNAESLAAEIANVDLSFHCAKTVNRDYEDFVKQIADNIKLTSEAVNQQSKRIKEDTIQIIKRRSQLKTERKTDEAYKKLCNDIRKKVKEDYEEYKKERLREAAATKESLRAVEKDIRLK